MKQIENIGEIVMYQPDETIRLEVRLEDETVWLTQAQMAELFQTTRNNITLHVGNIFKEGELQEFAVRKESLLTAADGKNYRTKFYNLDIIISVGYRVKSQRGTKFRQWANQVIKDYLLRGYAINQQLTQLEQRMDARIDAHVRAEQQMFSKIASTLADHQEKIDFFVRTNQPPVAENVGQSLTHLQQLNHQQFGRRIEVKEYNSRFHDRFLILDDVLYHFGASFKDLGKRLFAFELMGIDKNIILNQL